MFGKQKRNRSSNKKKKLSPEKFLFGEDQSRYLIVINDKKEFESLAKKII